MIKDISIFVTTTIFLVLGQALWKMAFAQVSKIDGIENIVIKLSLSKFFVTGAFFYIVATGLWIYLLGQYEYSKIYPVFVGTCVMLSLIVGVIFFQENTGMLLKILGSIFIMGGIIIISKA